MNSINKMNPEVARKLPATNIQNTFNLLFFLRFMKASSPLWTAAPAICRSSRA